MRAAQAAIQIEIELPGCQVDYPLRSVLRGRLATSGIHAGNKTPVLIENSKSHYASARGRLRATCLPAATLARRGRDFATRRRGRTRRGAPDRQAVVRSQRPARAPAHGEPGLLLCACEGFITARFPLSSPRRRNVTPDPDPGPGASSSVLWPSWISAPRTGFRLTPE